MITLNNKSLYIAILSLVSLFCLPIILYNGYYIDDNIRIITGSPDWSWVGRSFADYLLITLSLNKYIDDFSPIPLIIGLLTFSYVLYYAIKENIPNPTIISIMPFIFIIVNPFFMQNLTYKFDSLPMILALSCSVFAFFISIENKIREWIAKIFLLFLCLEFYQPCANIFLALGACNILIDLKKNEKPSKINGFFIVISIYAISTLLYMFFEKIIHPDIILDRGHIVPFNEIASTIKENIKELLKMSSFLIGNIGIIIFCLPILFYWFVGINNNMKEKTLFINKVIYLLAPFIIFLSIWGPLIVIKEKISLPRELPTVGVLLFLFSSIILSHIKMKIKKIIIAATTFAIIFSTCIGIKSLADNYWTGHGEIQTINNNIDTLSNRVKSKNQVISDLNQTIANLKSSVDSQSSQVNSLQTQLTQANVDKQNEINAKINEINTKIAEGNQKVADKQKEVDTANQTISQLNQQLNDLRQKSGQDNDQALREVQDTRAKSDQAIKDAQ